MSKEGGKPRRVFIETYSRLLIKTKPKKAYLIRDYNFYPDYTNILKRLILKLGLKEDIDIKE